MFLRWIFTVPGLIALFDDLQVATAMLQDAGLKALPKDATARAGLAQQREAGGLAPRAGQCLVAQAPASVPAPAA